jgi:membrane protease YdiL (CAAX protease family)
MNEALISILAVLGGLLIVGTLLGLSDRKNFDLRWLLAALALIFVNDAALTYGYGLIPDYIGGAWNWQGKALALAITLSLAALPFFRWKRAGLTLEQKPNGLRSALPVAVVYCLFFLAIAIAFGGDEPTGERIAFQLTMPGFEEEPFYRGLLLLCFDQAFRGRIRLLGVEWGWGAVLSCMAFGLAHAFGFADGAFSFDPMIMALTALPSFIAVWLRYRTGSVLIPVILHNFGNAIGLLV